MFQQLEIRGMKETITPFLCITHTKKKLKAGLVWDSCHCDFILVMAKRIVRATGFNYWL